MDNVRALKEIFLFKDVEESVLRLVAQAAEQREFPPGDTLVTESQTPPGLFLIRSGTVKVTREGGKVPVTFGSGEALGAVSFLDGGPAGMTAEALERVEGLLLRPQKVGEKLAADPKAAAQFYQAVARSLAGRLRRAADLVAASRKTQG
ncbi:MAG TPA: cyclic nucleotide-binding domain-containing protein [Anaeromyxobacteraceae bacterium]|nr:cyclic nucleotide-binding domain-containing protein [Anaeromyxobacteraceae bacterium]